MNMQRSQPDDASQAIPNEGAHEGAFECAFDLSGDLSWLAFQYVAGELTGAELAAFEQRLEQDQAAREAVAEMVELTTAVQCVAAASSATPRSESTLQSDDEVKTLALRSPVAARPWWTPAVWMSAGAAVCLLAITAAQTDWRWLSGRMQNPNGVASDDGSDLLTPQQLALVWSQTRQATSELADGSLSGGGLTDMVNSESDDASLPMAGDILNDTDEDASDDGLGSSERPSVSDVTGTSAASDAATRGTVERNQFGTRRTPSWMMAAVSAESNDASAKPAPKSEAPAAPQLPQGL